MLNAPIQPDVPAVADRVDAELTAQDDAWRGSSTRRTFLQGLGMAGVAVLGSQLVTTRAAYAATRPSTVNTLITIALRGGVDGLRLLVPATSSLGLDELTRVRPLLVPGPSKRLALSGAGGGAMNKSLQPLAPLWDSGELAFVPAVASPGGTRSHFDSLRNLYCGSTGLIGSGWLDRVLGGLGAGTTFRAMGMGQTTAPASYLGAQPDLVLSRLGAFAIPAGVGREARTLAAIESMYRGVDPDQAKQVADVARALRTATAIPTTSKPANGTSYPVGALGGALADVARLLRAEVGMQVCTMDVGGWDTHSNEAQNLDQQAAALATALAAFFQDLGPQRRSRVTVLVQTEFGRRVAQNGTGGTDHGMGSVAMLLGGGLKASGVYGRWDGVTPDVLDHGDVPGLNSPFDVMGELAHRRLGFGGAATLFPDHTYRPLGIAKG